MLENPFIFKGYDLFISIYHKLHDHSSNSCMISDLEGIFCFVLFSFHSYDIPLSTVASSGCSWNSIIKSNNSIHARLKFTVLKAPSPSFKQPQSPGVNILSTLIYSEGMQVEMVKSTNEMDLNTVFFIAWSKMNLMSKSF